MTKKILTKLLFFSYLFLAFPVAFAGAQNKFKVQVLGLSILCQNCELREDPCQIKPAGSASFKDCKSHLVSYLKELQKGAYTGASPSLVEIRKYLYSDKAEVEVSSLLVGLITQLEAGAKLLVTDGQFLIDDYEISIAKSIQDNRAVPILGEDLWRLSVSGLKKLSNETLASIAASNPEISFEDLFDVLGKRSGKSIEELARIEYLFRRSGQLIAADQLHEAIISIDECLEDVSKCQKEGFSSLSPSVANYLKELKEAKLVSIAPSGEDKDPVEIVETIRSLSSGASLSAEGQVLLVEALSRARMETLDTARRKLVRPKFFKLLSATAKKNKKVGKELSELLVKVSKESASNGEVARSIEALEKSIQVYSGILPSRSRLIIDLQTDVRIQKNPNASKALNKLLSPKKKKIRKVKKKKILKEKLNPIYLFVFVLFAALLWLITLFSYFKKQRNIDTEDRDARVDLDIWRKERDKRQLRAFFELDENSTEEDLVRSYRTMVKAIHPDGSGQDTGDEFRELSDLFEQAQRIFFSK